MPGLSNLFFLFGLSFFNQKGITLLDTITLRTIVGQDHPSLNANVRKSNNRVHYHYNISYIKAKLIT